jgi:hypothetical protein
MFLHFTFSCKFDVKVGTNGLNQNPSFNEEHITRVHYHGEVDLEAVPRWHASIYLVGVL